MDSQQADDRCAAAEATLRGRRPLGDPMPARARSRRSAAAVRRRRIRIGAAGAAATLAAAALVTGLNGAEGSDGPTVEVDVPADGAPARAQLRGWLAEVDGAELAGGADLTGSGAVHAEGRPTFRVTVDGREVHRGAADGEARARWLPFARSERRFDARFGLTPGAREICLHLDRAAGRSGRAPWCRTVVVPAPSGPTRTTAPSSTAPALTTVPPAPLPTSPRPAPTAPPVAPPASDPAPTPTPTPPAPDPAPAPAGWHSEMLASVNEARGRAALPALVACGNLDRAAQGYAETMDARNWFDHTGPDGSTPAGRAAAAGYTGPVGENIAQGYPDVAAVMRGWLGSPGHRANILGARTTHLGVGRSGTSWVQLLGSGGAC